MTTRGGSPESAGKKLGTRRTWSSPNVPDISALRVDVRVEAKEEDYVSDIEATPKEKGYRPLFWMQRCRDYNQVKAFLQLKRSSQYDEIGL